jgi:hypothetical protein
MIGETLDNARLKSGREPYVRTSTEWFAKQSPPP